MRRLALLLLCVPALGGPPGFAEILDPASPLKLAAKKQAFLAEVKRVGLGRAVKSMGGFEDAIDKLQKTIDGRYAVYAKAGAAYWGWRQKTGGVAEEVPRNINRNYIDRETALKGALVAKRRQRSLHAWVEQQIAEMFARLEGRRLSTATSALTAGLGDRNPHQRVRCARLLTGVEAARPALDKRAHNERKPVVAAAMFRAHGGFDLLAFGLEHAAWQVRAAAMQGLAEGHRTRASTELLVKRLEVERGVGVDDCTDALRSLTGVDSGWKEWLAAQPADWKPPPPSKEVSPSVLGAGQIECMGISTSSRRIVFCFDRPDAVGAGFTKCISSLPEGVEFNVVICGAKVRTFKRKLVPAHGGTKQEAARFIAGAKPDGKSDVDTALRTAIDMGADTIFFFTANGPGSSPFTTQLMFSDPTQVGQEIPAYNRVRGVRIHAVGPSGARNGFWLQNIAHQFRGTFRGS